MGMQGSLARGDEGINPAKPDASTALKAPERIGIDGQRQGDEQILNHHLEF